MKSIKERMVTLQTAITESISTIKNMESESMEKGLEIYKESGDLSKALAYINQYEIQKAKILEEQRKQEQERQRKEEEERIRKQEQERLAKEQAEKEAEKSKQQQVIPPEAISEQETGFPATPHETVAFIDREDGSSAVQVGGTTYEAEHGFNFGVPEQEPSGFQQPETVGFDTPPDVGFSGFQQAGFQQEKTILYTVHVSESQREAFESLMRTYGYIFTTTGGVA